MTGQLADLPSFWRIVGIRSRADVGSRWPAGSRRASLPPRLRVSDCRLG